MIGLCNLTNVAYQGIFFPKENITDKKKLYLNFITEMEIKVYITTIILSLMNTGKKQPCPDIFGNLKIRF